MLDTHASVSDAEQAAILGRLFADPHPTRHRSWWSWLLQVALIVALVGIAVRLREPVPSLSIWDFQDPELVVGRLFSAAGHFALQAVIFFLLGLLLPLAFRVLSRKQTRPDADEPLTVRVIRRGEAAARPARFPGVRSLVRRAGTLLRLAGAIVMHVLVAGVFLAAVLTASVAVSTMLIDVVGVSRSLDVGLALAGLCAGIWVGWWASRGWSGVGGLMIQAAAATAFAVAGGLWLTSQVVQAQPYDITLPKINSADKRELVNAVRQHSELRDGHHIYHLTTEQLNKLLAWWIAFQSVDSKAMVQLTDDEQQAFGSLRLPARISPRRPFLNLAATGRCEITDEKLEMDIRSAQVGAVAVPGPITRYASRLLARWVNDDPVNVDLLVGVSAVITHKRGVDVYVSDDGLQHRRWAKMLRQTNQRFDRSDVSSAIRVYLDEFAQISKNAKPRQPLFDVVVRRAFELARDRSVSGNPVQENRTAILALGVSLGISRLGDFLGDVWEDDTRAHVARLIDQSQLRGRGDWPRHFWVSAALTLMADSRVSDALGLLKEEIDAGEGGSGFSFSDLTADRAGIAFAAVATSDAESARAIQAWVLAADTDLQLLMPAASDLPEGMSDQQMLSDFDGVDGPRYRKMEAEIQRRVADLPWWRETDIRD